MSTPGPDEEIHRVSRTQSVEPVTSPPPDIAPNSAPSRSPPVNPGCPLIIENEELLGGDIGGGESHTTPDDSLLIKPTIQDSDSRPKSKLCGVCRENEPKYKCASCLMPYCSVVCSTIHRATHTTENYDEMSTSPTPQDPLVPSNGVPTPVHVPVAHSKSGNPFAVLETSQEMKTLFMMYPRLRSQLREIYTATLPPADAAASTSQYDDSYQSHQRGRGGRGRGGSGGMNGRGRGGRHQEVWNSDRGTQNGIDAISDAKNVYGKGGEGVVEYANLVLKLVSTEGIDVANLVQEEASEDNAKIIAELLNGESY